MSQARAAAESAARDGYGRLVAFLSSRCRDLAAVEDALSQAFLEALEQWPREGVPRTPEAWLLTVARRRLLDAGRSPHSRAIPMDLFDLASTESGEPGAIPDERLKLLFVCTHPAIDPVAQTPLMLQTVLGFDAATIAKIFVVSAPAMSQRLVRAKTRIRDLGIPFVVPELGELPDRIDAVLNAIYALYGHAREEIAESDSHAPQLVDEAIHLSRVVASLLPEEPEPRGLLALMLHCEARRPARRDSQGRYVPLSQQDTTLWSRARLVEAEHQLWSAASRQRPGRFQLEAAIQSAHNRRAIDGIVPWNDILVLYRELIQRHDTIGARVAYAAALGATGQPGQGITILDDLPAIEAENYQPHWAVRAHLLSTLGREAEADVAQERAVVLSDDPAIRDFFRTLRPGNR